jgi:hypothetical protein
MEDKKGMLRTLQELRVERDKAKQDYEELSITIRRLEARLGISENAVSAQVPNSMQYKGLPQSIAAEMILQEAGHYLHVSKIVERMVLNGFDFDGDLAKLKSSVNTVLYKSPKFMKHKTIRGTYGLAEWGPEEAEAPISN